MSSMQDWLAAQAAGARPARHRLRHTVPRTGAVLDLASNDYLGLAADPRLQAAAVAAVERYGTGARASRVVTGTHAVHEELEAELCASPASPRRWPSPAAMPRTWASSPLSAAPAP